MKNERLKPLAPGLTLPRMEIIPQPAKKAKCTTCNDSGAVWHEKDGGQFVSRCECLRRKMIMQAIQDSGVPAEFWQATLQPEKTGGKGCTQNSEENTLALDATIRAYYAIAEWKLRGGSAPWLVLEGSFGIGKTRLASALLLDLIRSGFTGCTLAQCTMLVSRISAAISTGQGEPYVLQPLQTAPIAVLDDLNPSQVRNQDQFADKLNKVLLPRYDANLPTIVTTNDPAHVLRECLGGAVMSRVLGRATWLKMNGPDRRQTCAI